LGNNPDAADCAKAWQEEGTKEGFPQKWQVQLKPAKGGESRGRSLEQYRRKVTQVSVRVELIGKSKSKWQKVIEEKKRMPNPYLAWPDQWLQDTVKQLASVGMGEKAEIPNVYPAADVTLTLIINGKVGAIARYKASTKMSSIEIHY
jgi:hypothetical protein